MSSNFFKRTIFGGGVLVAATLTACTPILPERVSFQVSNDTLQGVYQTCPGGLSGAFAIADISMASLKVEVNSEYRDAQITSADAPAGTVATAEATCYGGEGEEVGYVRVERPWHAANSHGVFVFGPAVDAVSAGCLEAKVSRGTAPCIISSFLE